MWLFKHKFHANGTLSRYKARLVANGSSQQQGIDVDETFSPVVKPATIRTVLSLAVSRKWPIHQLDVKNAFLNGNLSETMYMHQPPGFTDPRHPNHVYLLQHCLYGLKQAPRAWFQRFAGYAIRDGFVSTCMTHGNLTLLPLNVSCGTSGVLWTSVSALCFRYHLPR
nr:ribonuclease H-like domain-containing protein [Tanacetum cinerariifolium]